MMVLHKDTGRAEHLVFKDIIHLMQENDVVIFNNTKVFPARFLETKKNRSRNRSFSSEGIE